MTWPRFAKTERISRREYVTEGLLKTKEDLKLLDNLPGANDEPLYRPAKESARQWLLSVLGSAIPICPWGSSTSACP